MGPSHWPLGGKATRSRDNLWAEQENQQVVKVLFCGRKPRLSQLAGIFLPPVECTRSTKLKHNGDKWSFRCAHCRICKNIWKPKTYIIPKVHLLYSKKNRQKCFAACSHCSIVTLWLAPRGKVRTWCKNWYRANEKYTKRSKYKEKEQRPDWNNCKHKLR